MQKDVCLEHHLKSISIQNFFFFSVNKIKFEYCREMISTEVKGQLSSYKYEINVVIQGENTKSTNFS